MRDLYSPDLSFHDNLPITRLTNRQKWGFLPDKPLLRVASMEYTVQRGDTIAHVSKTMGTNWQKIKELNPKAVGRSSQNGNWFLREGATISDQPKADFAATLKSAQNQQVDIKKSSEGASEKNAAKNSKTAPHTLKSGETVWGLATKKYHVNPQDILELNNIKDPRTLQIGQTLRIPEPAGPSGKEEVVASWYGSYHQGRPMANGKPFNMYAQTIAHKDIPLGTKVLLENPETGERATATVTDRGPYVQGRDVDLSYKLAQRLSLDKQGVGNLIMEVL